VRQIDFKLPSLGADMESATLTAWLKKPGDIVHRGEALATVETDKGLIDVESYADGTVAEMLVKPGTKVPVGALLARLHVEAEAAVPAAAPLPAQPPVPPPAAKPMSRPMTPAAQAPSELAPARPVRARISPAARRRAEELGIAPDALDALAESAAGGIVHVEDVEGLAAHPAAAPTDSRQAMRTAIGNAMARSKREIPHYYLAHSIDFGRTQEWLRQYNAQVPVQERLVEAVLITKAVAQAAVRIEGFNGYFRDGRFEPARAVHVGSAIAVHGGGLVAPALLDADRKDLKTLMQELSALVTRVRAGHMLSGEFSTATITVTSLGADGADVLYPIINPPQVAIVGAGAVGERPWAHDGKLAVRRVLTLTLAADHRVTDGRAGSRFVRAIADALASPETL